MKLSRDPKNGPLAQVSQVKFSTEGQRITVLLSGSPTYPGSRKYVTFITTTFLFQGALLDITSVFIPQ